MPTFSPARTLVPRWRTRMLPASTCSPPKRLTPRRLLWESRPLRVLPPAFLCAMGLLQNLGRADFGHAYLCELLPMRFLPQIVLAASKLNDGYLVALGMLFDRRRDLAAGKQRFAQVYDVAVSDQENLVKLHRRAKIGAELFDAQYSALLDPILFAARGDDRVHCPKLRVYRCPRVGDRTVLYHRPPPRGVRKGRAF